MKQVTTMKLSTTGITMIVLGSFVPLAGHTQQFSADVDYLATAGRPGTKAHPSAPLAHDSSRLFVSKDQLRLETRGLSGTILLVDRAAHTSFALYPEQKAYQPLTSGPAQYFRVAKAEDACADWQQAAGQKISCEKAGPEDVAGRHAMKYVNKGASAAAVAAVWVDVALNYTIKWEGAGASAELHNIKEAEQSADLFTVPSQYVLLTPQKAKSKGFAHKPPH